MNGQEALLVFLIILLILYTTSQRFKDVVDKGAGRGRKMVMGESKDVATVQAEAPSEDEDGPVKPPVAQVAEKTPEQAATAENTEHFSNCSGADQQMQQDLSNMCEGGDYSYAVNEFGAPGMDYKDWVAAQSVDPAVVKNHAEFVSDRARLREGNLLGSTYSPDMHMSYDPISWGGLRRPQAVPVCNPTQVPDVDYNLYNTESTFSWKSGSSALH
jgi:hypothetical protein